MNGKIYLITNMLSGKQYVGQTIRDLKTRWRCHKKANYCKDSESMPVIMAIKKYGAENFKFESIVDGISTMAELNRLELHYALLFNTFSPNGYNICAGSSKGGMSIETRKKIGDAHRGKKASVETLKRLRDSHLGHKVSEQTKQKLSAINKGKKPHEKVRIAASLKNAKTYSLEMPDGSISLITNLRKYCNQHGHHYPRMCSLGTTGQYYKGFKLKKTI